MNVVVVESPAKAKTINKYLGDGYVVLASYGHVRDLPAKDGSVRPEEDFAMTYVTDDKSVGHIRAIARALKGAKTLYLATDPDREGEAIAWHVMKALAEQNAVKGIDVKRVVFNEITRGAVRDAMQHPRAIDMDLVNAQQARRALDYLVGFTLSPVLWRKLPGARSAGRVQSVALRLICERDLEIDRFVPQEYWTIEGVFRTPSGQNLTARLVSLSGEKLEKLSLKDKAAAETAVATIMAARGFHVAAVTAKQQFRNPPPPFTTSTLQQEASRKLRLSAKRTMQIAQRLYEGINIGGETTGFITYMRTDGMQMAAEAIEASRRAIGKEYGPAYVPGEARIYKTKAKNAQEAHEAIRPTDMGRLPAEAARYLDDDQARLYELIWKRAIASQMASARVENAAIEIAAADGRSGFRATGTVILFDGFLKLYQEGRDDVGDDDEDRALPKVREKDSLTRQEITPSQHFTEPPPRYTEATLVKKLEELGIGRPSTYAAILSVLQDRNYVRLDKGRFFAEDRGQLVTAFLVSFFERYVEYDFTADLETKLDEVSAGEVDWKQVLAEFWRQFKGSVDGTKELRVRDVLDALNEILSDHVFRPDGSGRDPRLCPACNDGQLSLKVGKFGAFVGCSNYPDCKFSRPLVDSGNGDGTMDAGPRELGKDPETGEPLSVRKGPYGHYVQRGEGSDGEKPKRVSIPKGFDPATITLDQARSYLALPREIGRHPESGKKIVAGIGRFGPYIKHGDDFRSLSAGDDVLTVGLNRAVSLLAEPKRQRRGPTALKVLGSHPSDGKPVQVFEGRYGPYVSHEKVNATLPGGTDPQDVTLETALALLAERTARGGKAQGKGKTAKGAPAEKTAPRAKSKPPAKTKTTDNAAPAKVKAPAKRKKKAAIAEPVAGE